MSNLALETVLVFSGCVTVQFLEPLNPSGGATAFVRVHSSGRLSPLVTC